MSIHVLSWAFKQKVGSSSTKLVLINLADHYNDHCGYGYPSIPLICDETELDRKTVISCIKKLEGLKILTVERSKKGTKNESNQYRFNMGVVPKTVLPKLAVPKTAPNPLSSSLSSSSPNPNVRVFIDWWCTRHQEVFHEKYKVEGGKEGKLVKKLLEQYPLETLQKVANRLLSTTDPWLLKIGRTIPNLSGQWNKLQQEEHQPFRPGIDGPDPEMYPGPRQRRK